MVCDLDSKLEGRLCSTHSSLAREFDALAQSLLRLEGQLLSLESMVEQRCAALQASLGSDSDPLSLSVERIGRLDDKLTKEIHARLSMREHFLAGAC